MPDDYEQEIPRPKPETIILDGGSQLAIISDHVLWPPVGAVVELCDPNRWAVVDDVRLRLTSSHASVVVRVHELGEEPV
jgi:hypothetical protein